MNAQISFLVSGQAKLVRQVQLINRRPLKDLPPIDQLEGHDEARYEPPNVYASTLRNLHLAVPNTNDEVVLSSPLAPVDSVMPLQVRSSIC